MRSLNISRIAGTTLVLGAMLLASSAEAYTTYKYTSYSMAGQNMYFAFTGLPVASGNVSVKVDVFGDYEANDEYAEIWIDNVKQANHTGGGTKTCNTKALSKTYTVPASYVADTVMSVRVDNSAAVGVACSYRRVTVTLTYSGTPDLRVTSSTVPKTGSTAGHGSTFTAEYKVTAYHEPVSKSFDVSFYYCQSYTASNCTYIGKQTITDAFKANQTRTYNSPKLTMPATAAVSTYRYIRTYVDSGNAVKETYESNNNDYDRISVTKLPDLSITAAKVPNTGATTGPGSKFTGSYTLSNTNNTSMVYPDFYMRYYYCPKKAYSSTTCTYLGYQYLTQNINSGAKYTFTSISLTIPSTALPGTAYIYSVADAYGNRVKETNEKNNTRWDAITLTQGGPGDLQVSASTVPKTGDTKGPGSKFTASYTILNGGKGHVNGNFYVRFYYCPAASTAGCSYLGYQYVSTNFKPGASATFTSGTLTMPSTAKYGTGYIRFFADSSNYIKESNETNNNRYHKITVTKTPDLYFTASTVPQTGSTAKAGDKFTGRYTIRNSYSGTAFTTDFYVSYYYCTSTSATSCTYLTNQKITANFNPGTYYSFNSTSLTMPAAVKPGYAYIRAFVDSTNVIKETSEANNNDYDQILVGGSGSVDLIVSASSVPLSGSTAGAGSTFTASYTLKNTGKGVVTNNFYTYFYYCPGSSSSGCKYLGNQYITTNFGGGQSTKFTSPTLTMPNSAAVGSRYIRFYTDATNTVSETSGSNNYRYHKISVTTLPDVSFSLALVPYTGDVYAAGSKFTGRYTITNAAKTSYFTTNFYTRFYFCTAQTASSCTYLNSYRYITNNFNAGGTYTFDSSTLTLPKSAKAGTAYIRALADSSNVLKESNEKNNDVYTKITIGGKKLPDLRVDSVIAPFTGNTMGAKSLFTVRYRVVNSGKAGVTTNFTAYYYYCPAQTTSKCTWIAKQTITTPLGAGASSYVTTPVMKVPTAARYGTGYFRVFVDALNNLKEAVEHNNNAWDAISVTTRPDLYFVSGVVPASGSTAGPGSKFTGTFTLRNGTNTSYFATDFTVRYYYCSTATSSGCTYLAAQTITTDFFAGTTNTFNTPTLTLPATALKGVRYIRAYADATNAVTEYNEINNDYFKAISVGSPDYYISSFFVQTNGTTVTYTAKVCNKGSTAITPTVMSLYYHLPVAPGCSSKASQSTTVKALANGACSVHTFTQTGASKGAFVGWVMADAACKAAEGDEKNNTSKWAYTVTPPVPDQGIPDMPPLVDMAVDGEPPDAGVDLPPLPPDTQPGQEGTLPPPDMPGQEGTVPPPDLQGQEGTLPPPDLPTGDLPTGDLPTDDLPTGDQTVGEGTGPTPDGPQPTTDLSGFEAGPRPDAGGEPEEKDGCSCAVDGSGAGAGLWLLSLLALLGLRRRRR